MAFYTWPAGLQTNLLLSNGEVPVAGAPGGSGVRESGGCRDIPVSSVAGTRGPAGQESLFWMEQFCLSSWCFSCWVLERSFLASPAGLLTLAVP